MTTDLQDIWVRVLDGDTSAWEELVDRFAVMVYSVARRHGLEPGDAEDCSQQTWMALYQSRHRIRRWEKLPGWLAGTAYRRAMRILRKRLSIDRAEKKARKTEPPTTPDKDYQIEQRRALLDYALSRLDERCRSLLKALFFSPDDVSYREIAEQLGITSNSLGPTRQRCLAKLRTILLELDSDWY